MGKSNPSVGSFLSLMAEQRIFKMEQYNSSLQYNVLKRICGPRTIRQKNMQEGKKGKID